MRRPLLPRLAAVLALLLVAALVACEPVAPPKGPPTISCDRAAERITLTESAVLDPSCTYTGGFAIAASGVTLECAGATIADPTPTTGGVGILVTAPADADRSDIAVRHCTVRGFTNGLRVTRDGFKALPVGGEYEHGYRNVLVEDSTIQATNGTGLYIDGDVTGVTLQRLTITDAGGPGIYLEAGSRGIQVLDNVIHHVGWAGAGPEGTSYVFGGTVVRYRSRGREGIAVDGSRDDLISGNRIDGAAAGGILLYKNCGEYVHQPAQWWRRPYGSDGNTIIGNTISDERVGVWVGSRQDENQAFMDCSDPVVLSRTLVKIYEDHARGNRIEANRFDAVTWGVRVEDDDTAVVDNRFTTVDAAGASVAVGSQQRSGVLHHPVTGTIIQGNSTDAPDDGAPYRWAYGEVATSFGGNLASKLGATWQQGPVFAPDPFLFVAEFLPSA